MTDKARLKEGLKKVLRALLLSAPLGLTPKELEKDFREVEGHELPYRRLGYNTVNDLLQDMPDVVSTSWDRGNLVIRGKADQTTAHIKSLVSRQKVDVTKALKKRAAVERRSSRSSHFGRSVGGRMRPGAPGVKPRGPRFGVRPTVPAHLQTEIKSFLMIHPNGVLNTEFEMQFAKKFGHTIPYSKMGFSSLRDLTMSMNTAVSVEMLSRGRYRIYERSNYPGGGSNRGSRDLPASSTQKQTSLPNTRHPASKPNRPQWPSARGNSSFNSKQPKGFANPRADATSRAKGFSARAMSSTRTNIEQARSSNQPRASRTLQPANLNSTSRPPPASQAPATRPESQSSARASIPRYSSAGQSSSSMGTGGQTSSTGATAGLTSRQVVPDKPSTSANATKTKENTAPPLDDSLDAEFGKDFLMEIQQVMEKNPNGIMAASLPTAYKQHTGKELPMFSLGFYSVVELVCAMPSIVTVEREERHGDWTLFDARTHQPKPESPVRQQTSSRQGKTTSHGESAPNFEELKEMIYDTLSRHRDGLLIQELPEQYERVHDVKFPMQELGFSDVDSVVLLMQDVINIAYKGRDHVYLYPVEGRLPPSPPGVRSHKASLPADAVGFGPQFKPAKMPPVSDYAEVYVATVFTPHKLSLQLKDAAMNTALEDLMDDLEQVYCYPEGDLYEMPEPMIAVSQVCCALYHEDNNWHRAIITGIPNMDFVEVVYVDYGTVASVPKASLRLLKSMYMKLPIQAVDAKLSSIEPTQGKWTKAACARLLQLTLDKTLICMTTEVKNNIAIVLLADTSTEEDIHINDCLVDEGHARFIVAVDEEEAVAKKEPNDDDDSYHTAYESSAGDRAQEPSPEEFESVEPTVGANGDHIVNEEERVSPPGLPEVSSEERTNNLNDAQQLYDKDAVLETNSSASELDPQASPFQPKPDSTPSETDSEIREINKEMEQISLDEEFGISWVVKCYELADQWLVHVVLGSPDGDVYMLTEEIAGLLEPSESEGNGLNTLAHLMLEMSESGAEIEVFNFSPSDAPGLFEELIRLGVTLNGVVASELTTVGLLSLSNALLLLSSSGNLDIEFLTQMQEMQSKLTESPVEEEEKESETKDDTVVTLEELVRYMKCLEINRKRCLDAMMASGGTQYVDELQEIESTIAVIKEKIEEIHSTNSDVSPFPQSPMSPSPASKEIDTEPVIDIPAGHPSPFMEDNHPMIQPTYVPYMEESPKKLTQVVQPILQGAPIMVPQMGQIQQQPPAQQQIPISSMHTPIPQHQRPSNWSSGYNSSTQQAPQPGSYTLQSSLTLQQNIPPFVAQYSIQQVPQPMMNAPPPQGPPMMQRGGPPPQTPQRGMVGPPPNIAPPPHMRGPPPPPQHIRMHPPAQLGRPIQAGLPPHGGPPPHMRHGRGPPPPPQQQFRNPQGGMQYNQPHASGIGRGVSQWQY